MGSASCFLPAGQEGHHQPPAPLNTWFFFKMPLLLCRRQISQWSKSWVQPQLTPWQVCRAPCDNHPPGPWGRHQACPPPTHPAGPHRLGSLLAADGGWEGHSPSAVVGSSSAPGTSWACSAASGWARRLQERRDHSVHAHQVSALSPPFQPSLRQAGEGSTHSLTLPQGFSPLAPLEVSAGLSTHLSCAEGSVLGGRKAGWEQEARSC